MLEDDFIGLASDEHLVGVLDLYKELHPDIKPIGIDVALQNLQKLASYEGSGIFIACNDGKVVATCTLIVVPNLTRNGSPYAIVENVVTSCFYRRRGLGRKVIQAAVTVAWSHGCYKVMLMTGSKDPSVLRFYQGLGFAASKVGFEMRTAPVRLEPPHS